LNQLRPRASKRHYWQSIGSILRIEATTIRPSLPSRTPKDFLDDRSPSPPLTLVVLLYIDEGKRQQFDEFEAAASQIMSRYGGQISRRIAVGGDGAVDPPDEIHVVDFPDADAFSRYRSDSQLAALAELRSSAIRQTTIWVGESLRAWDP
jgi:uncharacterized protein (DUF1330 family)